MKFKLGVKTGWPKAVTLATPETVCTEEYHSGTRSCALGHFERNVKQKGSRPHYLDFQRAYKQAAKELYPDLFRSWGGAAYCNDFQLQTDTPRARVINRTWEILGYTEDVP